METSWEHPIVQAMVKGHAAASGRTASVPSPQQPVNFGAACDGSFLEDEGIPSVVFGPGDLRLAHCKDESVELDEMIAAAKSLAACVLEWCGVAA
jgi:acetylornithine deacetylase